MRVLNQEAFGVMRRKPLLSAIMTTTILSSFAGNAAAQSITDEVIVTSQKRNQAVSDVSIAVTALPGDLISQLGLTDSTKISTLSAGVDISAGGGGQNSQFVIRGASLNEFNEIAEGTTAVYLDEGYTANIGAASFPLHDIERVEILKGPQGTLFGRNATAGLVHYITAAPTQDTEGYAEATYASFNQVNVQGALSGAITDDLSGRISLYYNRHDSIFNNTFPDTGEGSAPAVGGPVEGGGQDHFNDDTISARGRLRWEPTENLTIDLLGHGSFSNQGEAPYQSRATVQVFNEAGQLVDVINAAPDETREGIAADGSALDTNGDGNAFRPVAGGDFFGFVDEDGLGLDVSKDFAFDDNARFDIWGFNGNAEWDNGDGLSVTYIGDYKKVDRLSTTDIDSGPTNTLVFQQVTDQSQISQELRVNKENGASRWVAGLYYLNVDTDYQAGILITEGSIFRGDGPAIDAINTQRLQTDSFSAFGQGELDFSDKFRFVLGARVIQEEKEFDFEQTFFQSTNDVSFDTEIPLFNTPTSLEDPSGAPFNESTSDTLWAGKAALEYRPNDDVLLYTSVSRGVKAGNFQAPLPIAGAPLAQDDLGYDEESLLAYEAGVKTTAFDGRVKFSASAYYYDYDDYQTFAFDGVSSTVSNEEATNIGAEFQVAATPIDGLDITTSLAYFDFTVKDILGNDGVISDRDPTYAPSTTWSGLARYELPLKSGAAIAFQGDANYKSSFFTNINNFSADRIGATFEANAAISYETSDRAWSFTGFINNIGNARNETIIFDLSGLCGCSEVAHIKPRWVGARARYNF